MIKEFLTALFFPKFCLNCKKPKGYICQQCFESIIQVKQQRCFFCKQNSFLGLTCFKCQRPYRPRLVFSLFKYNNLTSKVVKEIKFRSAYSVLLEFLNLTKLYYSKELEVFIKLLPKNTAAQPMPLHPQRLKERGFNQSELIYDNLVKPYNIDKINGLIRVKYSKPQSYMNTKSQRYHNVKDAFKPTTKKLPDNILLIDDILTSGHTMLSSCKTLIKNKVKNVYFFSFIGK